MAFSSVPLFFPSVMSFCFPSACHPALQLSHVSALATVPSFPVHGAGNGAGTRSDTVRASVLFQGSPKTESFFIHTTVRLMERMLHFHCSGLCWATRAKSKAVLPSAASLCAGHGRHVSNFKGFLSSPC